MTRHQIFEYRKNYVKMDVASDPELASFVSMQAMAAGNYDLSENRGKQTNLVCTISTIIAFITIVLRLIARFRTTFGYGLDDLLIIISMFFMIGNLISIYYLVYHGIGLHAPVVSWQHVIAIGKLSILNEIIYASNINLIKLSVLSMYHRFFPVRPVRLGGLVVGFVSCLWTLSFFFFALLQCTPFKKLYAPWTLGTCINQREYFLALTILNILIDIAILALPLPHVWKLHTTLWQKISLTLIFLLGSFVVLVSILRYISFLGFNPVDAPYCLASVLSWNMVELSSGIVSACLPTFGPIIRKFLRKIGASTKAFGQTNFSSSLGSRNKDESQSKKRKSRNDAQSLDDTQNQTLLVEIKDGKANTDHNGNL